MIRKKKEQIFGPTCILRFALTLIGRKEHWHDLAMSGLKGLCNMHTCTRLTLSVQASISVMSLQALFGTGSSSVASLIFHVQQWPVTLYINHYQIYPPCHLIRAHLHCHTSVNLYHVFVCVLYLIKIQLKAHVTCQRLRLWPARLFASAFVFVVTDLMHGFVLKHSTDHCR